jgi:arsenite methyltransferase
MGTSAPQRLYGNGLVTDCDGQPLSPGGPLLTEALLDLAKFKPGALVIDVGCGQGASVGRMIGRGLRAIGVDMTPAPLAIARRRTDQDAFIIASGSDLPFAAESVDGVLAECSLSVMPDRARALSEWSRILRPGGRLLLSDVYSRRSGDTSQPNHGGMLRCTTLWPAFNGADLTIKHFVDRSDVLKGWVARFIFRYGSLDALWDGACGLTAEAARRSSPGYFLMIAAKANDQNRQI